MPEKQAEPPSCEAQREREIQRYYQGWLSAHGSALNVALNVSNLAAADLIDFGYEPKYPKDEALAAFAQLAVLRMNVKRAMISLIDKTHQMVLAEATRNLFVGLGGDTPSADLWLGSAILVCEDAICEHCLTTTYTACDPANTHSTFSAAALVVPDCRNDERFHTRPYVVSEPGVRFYAGVPIVSRNGYKVGAYAVSDERPRHGLTIEELQFMQGVAQAVIADLELAQDRVDRFKGERIVRGLASFIEGGSQSNSPSASSIHDDLRKTSPTFCSPQQTLARGKRQLSRAVSSTPATEGYSVGGQTLIESPAQNISENKPILRGNGQNKSDGPQQMLTRATEILRQATLADGVVLFDAILTPGKNSTRSATTNSFRPSDEDLLRQVTPGSEGVSMDESEAETSPSSRLRKILAYAIADDAARANIEWGSVLTLGTLLKYFRLFPHGKTFSFTKGRSGISFEEDDGASDREPPITSKDPDRTFYKPGRRRKSRIVHEELLRKVPGAQVMVLLPLYDHTEERLASACFLWTSMADRMMNMDEGLPYLRAFGNIVMSKLERINTQKHEAAKTTFIASMGHELRTPLHGIHGATEILIENAADSY